MENGRKKERQSGTRKGENVEIYITVQAHETFHKKAPHGMSYYSQLFPS